MVACTLRNRLTDELSLAPIPMRRDKQLPRQRVGNLPPIGPPDDMDAAIEPRCHARGSKDLLRFNIQHFRVHFDAREISRQMRCPSPVRGCPLAAQQTRMSKYERPQTQTDNQRSSCMGCLKCFDECIRRRFGNVPPAWDDDNISPDELIQTMVAVDGETGVGDQHPILARTDDQFEPR